VRTSWITRASYSKIKEQGWVPRKKGAPIWRKPQLSREDVEEQALVQPRTPLCLHDWEGEGASIPTRDSKEKEGRQPRDHSLKRMAVHHIRKEEKGKKNGSANLLRNGERKTSSISTRQQPQEERSAPLRRKKFEKGRGRDSHSPSRVERSNLFTSLAPTSPRERGDRPPRSPIRKLLFC